MPISKCPHCKLYIPLPNSSPLKRMIMDLHLIRCQYSPYPKLSAMKLLSDRRRHLIFLDYQVNIMTTSYKYIVFGDRLIKKEYFNGPIAKFITFIGDEGGAIYKSGTKWVKRYIPKRRWALEIFGYKYVLKSPIFPVNLAEEIILTLFNGYVYCTSCFRKFQREYGITIGTDLLCQECYQRIANDSELWFIDIAFRKPPKRLTGVRIYGN